VIIDFYSVAVINLPIKTIKTAGANKPIIGTKTEGRRFENSDDIIPLTSLITLVFILEIMLNLLLDDIKIINFLHANFFHNTTHYFYCINIIYF